MISSTLRRVFSNEPVLIIENFFSQYSQDIQSFNGVNLKDHNEKIWNFSLKHNINERINITNLFLLVHSNNFIMAYEFTVYSNRFDLGILHLSMLPSSQNGVKKISEKILGLEQPLDLDFFRLKMPLLGIIMSSRIENRVPRPLVSGKLFRQYSNFDRMSPCINYPPKLFPPCVEPTNARQYRRTLVVLIFFVTITGYTTFKVLKKQYDILKK